MGFNMNIKIATTFLFFLLIIYLYQIPLANASSYNLDSALQK
jgi:hypothetical protein